MAKKELKGRVIKDQNDKTVVVLVKRRYSHPFFGKVITSSKNIMFMIKRINLK